MGGFVQAEIPVVALIGLGWPEMLIIALIVIILFGARRIPEVAKGLGEGIRSFKAGLNGPENRNLEDRKYKEEVGNQKESRGSA